MFGWEFPPFNSGGLGVACQGLTQALANQGTDIVFVLPKKFDIHAPYLSVKYADGSKTGGMKVKAIQSLLTPYITSSIYSTEREKYTSKLYAHGLIQEVYRYAAEAKHIAAEEAHDVIHAHDWLSFPAGMVAKQTTGKPLVAHIHATEFDRSGGNGVNQEVYDIEREGMHKATAVIAVSNFTKKIIVDKYGVNPNKVHVVYNGINLSDYTNAINAQNILALKQYGIQIVLFAGRITLQKGPDYFLQAAQRVLTYMPNTLFIMAGSGDMERGMIEMASRLGISDKITFSGYVRNNDLSRIYQSSNLLVMPSVSEPFGIAALEAVAHGTPVLVSKQSGVREVMSNALTADFWDTDEMANKIIAVLRHQSLSNCLRENSYSEVKQISWERAAKTCNTIYQQVS